MNIASFIALLNKILDFVNLYRKYKKNKELKEIKKAIDEDIESFSSANVDDDTSRVFTPRGKPPTGAELQSNSKSK